MRVPGIGPIIASAMVAAIGTVIAQPLCTLPTALPQCCA